MTETPTPYPIATPDQLRTPGNIIKFPDGRAYVVGKGGNLERVILIEDDLEDATPKVMRTQRKSKADKKAEKRARHKQGRQV